MALFTDRLISDLSSSAVETTRVLLVDDNEDHFIMTRRLFAIMRRGIYTLDWVGSYDAALEEIAQGSHTAYLIDHHLGSRDGVELIREVRASGCKAPIILFTADDDPNADMAALQAGATDYLVKRRVDALVLERTIHYAVQHTRQEQALRESEEKLSLALNAAAVGIVDWDIPNDCITYGGHFGELFDLPPQDRQPSFQEMLTLLHPEDQSLLQQTLYASMTDGSHYRLEFRTALVRGQERWMSVQGQSYLDSAGQAVRLSGVVQDITERREIEQRRIELLEREQEARRLSEEANTMKLRFLAMVSHELRTPLTSIKGFTSTLLEPDVEWTLPQYQEFLGIVDLEADKLIDLVAQLMDISRLQAGALQIQTDHHRVSDIINGAIPQLEAATGSHDLIIQMPSDLPVVIADRRRIEQVIVNLVENAAKYCPAGTTITVSAMQIDNHVQIDIDDQGEGIPSDQREQVFEAFHQIGGSANSQKGAGLGLAICKGLVEAHGGSIWVQDKDTPGARISFSLCCAQ
jgi:signal transduction histidine kinase/FixJ family two-component response regulator